MRYGTFDLLGMMCVFCIFQDIQHSETFQVGPSTKAEKLDTSQWPLLLKVGANRTGEISFDLHYDVNG